MATLSQQNSRHFFHFVLPFAACGTKREEPVIESLRSTCKVNKSRKICKLDSSYMQSLHMLCSIAERSLFMTYHFLWILKRYFSIACWIFTARYINCMQLFLDSEAADRQEKSDVYNFGVVWELSIGGSL